MRRDFSQDKVEEVIEELTICREVLQTSYMSAVTSMGFMDQGMTAERYDCVTGYYEKLTEAHIKSEEQLDRILINVHSAEWRVRIGLKR